MTKTTHTTPLVVITGAGGFLGSALTQHFSDKGWRVRALVRDVTRYKNTASVQYQHFDLEDFTPQALKGADYLVHAAFIKYDRLHADALEQNVAAAQKLITASRQYGLKRNVFISSMSSHDEAVSVYGRQKLAVEGLFNTKCDVSLRPGLIMGAGGIVQTMAKFMKSKHVVPLVDGGKQPLQIVALQDLVDVIDHAITKDVSGVLTIATPEVYSYRQFYQELAKSIGVSVLFVPVPFWLLLGVMRTIAALHLPLNIGEDNLWGLKMLRSADNAADLRRLGVKLRTLGQVLDDMRNSGQL